MKKYRVVIIIGVVIAAILFAAGIFFSLVYTGAIRLNTPSEQEYPVRGVDVSAYQGEIDWDVLAAQGISFVFIKATEGSSFVDAKFAENYAGANRTNLRVGAYHFFSYDSTGKTQAENFCKTVPKVDGMLPPVIDLEFYGDKAKDPPEAEAVRQQLDVLLERLEAHYGQKPVFYATEKSYRLYLADHYPDYDIWIRSVYFKPGLSDGRTWTFWQYSDKGVLAGYNGEEKYIDLNVFYGTEEAWSQYAKA